MKYVLFLDLLTWTLICLNAIKGQKGGQSSNSRHLCEPCENVGKRNEARGYCVECREYFCQNCADVHRGSKLSKSHKILIGSDMPASPLPLDEDNTLLTDICELHQKTKELIKFFCPTHDKVACGDCVVMTYLSCKVYYVIDVAKRFKGNRKYQDLREFMAGIEEKLRKAEEIIKDVTNNNMQVKRKALNDIKKLRADVIAFFDQKKGELEKELDSFEADDQASYAYKSTGVQELKAKYKTIMSEMAMKEKSPNQLFISATQHKPELVDIDKASGELIKTCEWQRRNYSFQPNPDVESIVRARKDIGSISSRTKTMPIQASATADTTAHPKVDAVQHRSSESKLVVGNQSCVFTGEIRVDPCNLTRFGTTSMTGMTVLSQDRLAFTDYNNSAVKLVDVRRKTIVSRLELSGQPCDLTFLPHNQLAVTLRNKMIQMITVNNDTLTTGRSLRVSGLCRGIDYNNDRLAVTYEDTNNVDIMDTNGAVQHVIKHNDTNKSRGAYGYVMFTPTGQEVFVTCDDNSVRKLSLSGAVLATYISSELYGPRGLDATTDGELLVCGYSSHTVHVVGDNGEIRTLLTKQNGLNYPTALCLCEGTRVLHVLIWTDYYDRVNCLSLFKLQVVVYYVTHNMGK